ncbi:hypothetical protein TNCV_3223711 [Trichonephila clavipes]|nr:hypothetical protein TNCV_3223711 [Trichonephila clavipes]
MIVQFRNEKVSNHGSIPNTIDCNVVAFIVFEEGFFQPIKRTKQVRRKAIFGSRAASKFSFGEKERPAQRSKLIYSVNGESVEGKRFSEAVLQVNSASEKGSVLLIEDQTDLHLQC